MHTTADISVLPVWNLAPAPHDPRIVNFNLLSHDVFYRLFHFVNETTAPIISETFDLEFLYGGSISEEQNHPFSVLLQPIFDDFDREHRKDRNHIVGVVFAMIPWDHYYENILTKDVNGIMVIMESSCEDQMTYLVNGPEVEFLGYGDLHDRKYDSLVEKTSFETSLEHNYSNAYEYCEYDLHIYPSHDLEEDYRTNHPIFYAILVFLVFVATAMVFILYDFYVTMRQNKVMLAAKRSNAVVASLFPKKVREKLLQEAEDQIVAREKLGHDTRGLLRFGTVPKANLREFLDDGNSKADGIAFDTKPIADLFPSATVM